jgi:hypothetical protein
MMPMNRWRAAAAERMSLNHAAHPIVRSVRHVEAKHVHTGFDEPGDHFGGFSSRAKGGNDFGFSHRDGRAAERKRAQQDEKSNRKCKSDLP